jgi:hypothetical protein
LPLRDDHWQRVSSACTAIRNGCFTSIRDEAVKPTKSAKTVKATTARRVIKPWTKEDVRTLKAHSKARTPVTKVSKVMKRTVGALRRRAGILGVALGHRR